MIDGEGRTELHRRCRFARCEQVRALIREGADVNARDDNGCTPLHAAAFAARHDVVALLLSEGADPGLKDNGGYTPAQAIRSSYEIHSLADSLKCVNILEAWQAAARRRHILSSRLHEAREDGTAAALQL